MTSETYYYGDNPSKFLPFDRLYAITHFIMPNFGTMNWHLHSREQINKNLLRFNEESGAMNDEIMMYIHVPYCKSFCHYCNFNKNHYPKQGQDKLEMYVDYLIKEIDWYMDKTYVQARKFTAIYIGGGTPSTLSASQMERLFTHLEKRIPNYHSIEKTFTGEPRSLSNIDKLKTIQDFGFNRITFGIETFNDAIRKMIGRADTLEDIEKVFENIQKVGFKGDRCVDLMYDLPGQTFDNFANDLDILINRYRPEEADLFGTVYLPYRPMHKLIMRDKIPQPGCMWQLLAMREYGYDFMLNHGYHNVIAETFSIHQERSQYQTAHCARQDIIGIGCAARGNIQDMVSINPEDIDKWKENIDTYGVSSETMQPIGRDGVLDRIMVMFPRYRELSKTLFNSFSDTKRFAKAKKILESHIKAGVVEEQDDKYVTNKLGVLWHGNMQTDFMMHTLNMQGRMLLNCISDKKSKFSEEKRFGRNIATKFILGHPELYPLLMK